MNGVHIFGVYIINSRHFSTITSFTYVTFIRYYNVARIVYYNSVCIHLY